MGKAISKREIIAEKQKYINEILKYSTPEPMNQYQQKQSKGILRQRGFELIQMKGHFGFQAEIHSRYLEISLSETLNQFKPKFVTKHLCEEISF